MSYRDHSSRNLGLLIDKKKPEEVVIGMTNRTVLQGHTAVSGRLSDWFNSADDSIVFHNARVDDGEKKEILIINRNQILWAKTGSAKQEETDTEFSDF